MTSKFSLGQEVTQLTELGAMKGTVQTIRLDHETMKFHYKVLFKGKLGFTEKRWVPEAHLLEGIKSC